ncbi:MAG: hypothetical protein ACOYL4_10300, partial [Miltoncostaeaceae bacterium]
MSAKRQYECTLCDRRAVVVGGPGTDLHDRTTTVGCCECGQLDDVVVARRIDGSAFSPDDDMSGELMPKCRACGADAVVAWVDGDPCPRCGGPLPGANGSPEPGTRNAEGPDDAGPSGHSIPVSGAGSAG